MSRRSGGPSPGDIGPTAVLLALTVLLGAASPARAQLTDHATRLLRLGSTPVGALPPIALPMPASRDNDYWAVRVAVGQLRDGGPGLRAIGGGLDFQWRGGSAFGLTAGYREGDCEAAGPDCGGQLMFDARARLNFITSGPTLAALIDDYTATSTLGVELGIGYGRGVLPDVDACNVDLGVPFSLAMLQTIRVSAFLKPGVVMDYRCSDGGPSTGISFFSGLGVALQQLGVRGLDLHLGLQRIFRNSAGYTLGATLSYTHIP